MGSTRSRTAERGRGQRPPLDEQCGRHFTYRQLIECGETWCTLASTGGRIDNVPLMAETYAALRELCAVALDPIVDEFGGLELSYGFASGKLARQIRGRIAPELDQHASCELTTRGTRVCARAGAAVDFVCPGVGSDTVAWWVVENVAFDRLYFYGNDRPIHVSVGPDSSRSIVIVKRRASNCVIPRQVTKHAFFEHLKALG